MLKRIIVVICVLVLFVSFACLSVGAAELDYNDYVTDVQVDGDNDIVTVSFPVDGALIQLYDGSFNFITEGYGSLSFDAVSNFAYRIDIMPLWGNYLDLTNIPQDTSISMSLHTDSSGLGFFWADSVTSQVMLAFPYDNSLRWVFFDEVRNDNFDYTYSFNLDKSTGTGSYYPSVRFDYVFRNVYLDAGQRSISVDSFTLHMSISSLYRLQQTSGKTNQILSEVEKQLADQGKTLDEVLESQKDTNNKLDDIINRPVEPETPSGSDVFDDLDDAENEIRDEAQSGLDAGLDIQNNVLDIFLQYTSAFAAAGAVFGLFSEIPFFASLLYISIAIGIFALLLNLSVEAGQSASQALDKDRKHTNRQIIKKSRRN